MANPYTDQRALLARLQQQGAKRSFDPGIATATGRSEAAVKLGTAASTFAINNPALRAQIDAIAAGRSQTSQKGVAGMLLGNPVTKGVLNVLNYAAMPGRAVVAGAREVADAIDSDSKTKASWGDFTRNVKDPTFGFGKAFNPNTGNIWIDRAIGLVGDVALDPLTYATFGAGKFAGYAGRLDLAKAVLETTGDSVLANSVQRFGRAAIKNPDILERVGANRHGIYFLGKRVKVGKLGQGVRLPGSGVIGMLGDNALAKLRISASGTKAGRYLQRLTLPAEGIAARQALLQGQMGDEAAATAISYFTASPVARRAAGEALQAEETKLLAGIARQDQLGLDAIKDDLAKLIENPDSFAAASPEMQAHAQYWIDLFKGYEDNIANRIIEIDPTANPAFVENYFPRMQTDDAIQYRMDPTNTHAKQLNEIFDRDPLAGGRNFKTRTMEVGDDFFGHKLTADDLKSVDRLNEIANEGGFVGKFFETDVKVVASKYIKEYAKEIGVLARHKHLADTGFWKRSSAIEVSGEIVDKEMVDAFKKTIKSLDEDWTNLSKEFSKSHIGLMNALEEHRTALKAQMAEAQKSLTGLEDIARLEGDLNDVLHGSLTLTSDQLQNVADNIGQMKGRFAEIFGASYEKGVLVMKDATSTVDDSPMVAEGLLGYLDRLETDVLNLRMQINPLEREAVDLEKMATAASNAVGVMNARLKEAQQRIKMVVEFGNVLEETMQKIVAGEVVHDIPREISIALAMAANDGLVGANMVRRLIENQFDVAGSVQKFMREAVNTPGSLFAELTASSPLSKNTIIKMKMSDFYEELPKLFADKSEIGRVRELAMFSLLMDERLYGGNIPEVLATLRTELLTQLRSTDDAVRYADFIKRQGAGRYRQRSSTIWENQIREPYARLASRRDRIAKMERLVAVFENTFSKNGAYSERAFNQEFLDNFYKSARLRDYKDVLDGYRLGYSGGDKFDFLEELMGANQPVAGLDAGDVQYIGAGVGQAETYAENLGQLVDIIKADIARERGEFQSLLDSPVYELQTQGFAAKEMTGRQVLDAYETVQNLKTELKALRGRRETLINEYKKRSGYFELDTSTTNGRARAAAIEEEARTYAARSGTQDMVLGDRWNSVREKIAEITGEGSLFRPEDFMDLGTQQRKLSDALINYQLVSEVHSRFSALSELTSAFGLVPTQRQFAKVLEGVGNKFLPGVRNQLSANMRAIDILKRMDSEFVQALNVGRSTGKTVNQIFTDLIDNLSDADRAILTQTVGNHVNAVGDAYTLGRRRKAYLAGISNKSDTPVLDELGNPKLRRDGKPIMQPSPRTVAENRFFEEQVKPWFESVYPGRTASKENMKRALKENASRTGRSSRGFRTPFAPDADSSIVAEWFRSLIGETSIPVRRKIMGHRGTLVEVRGQLRDTLRKFESMLAPDVNVGAFLDNPSGMPKTASAYAYYLKLHADKLTERLDARFGFNAQIREQIRQVREAGDTLAGYQVIADVLAGTGNAATLSRIQAQEELIAELRSNLSGMADTPEYIGSKSKLRKRIVAEQNKLKQMRSSLDGAQIEISARLKKLDPKAKGNVEEAQRIVGKYNEIMSSPAFAKAQSDREIINALDVLAEYDGHLFKNGFTADGENFAVLPDGTKITFTQEEWYSLFTPHVTTGETASLADEITSELKSINTEILALGRKRKEWQGKLQSAMAWPVEFNVERVQMHIRDIENEIRRLQSRQAEFRLRLRALDETVSNSALEKMRILVHGAEARDGVAASPRIFDTEGLRRFSDNTHPTLRDYVRANTADNTFTNMNDVWGSPLIVPIGNVADRRAVIRAAWSRSPQNMLLMRTQQLEKNLYVRLYQEFSDNAASMNAHILELRTTIDGLLKERAATTAPIAAERSSMQKVASLGSGALEDNLGKRVVTTMADGSEVELKIPSTAGEARQFADALEAQAAPDGPFFIKAETPPDAVGQLEQSYLDAVDAELNRQRAVLAVAPAKERAAEAKQAVVNANKAWEERIALKEGVPAIPGKVKGKPGVRQVTEELVAKRADVRADMVVRFGSVDDFFNEVYRQRGVVEALRLQIEDIDALINSMPSKESQALMRKLTKGKLNPEQMATVRSQYSQWLLDNKELFKKFSEEPDNPVYRAWAAAAQADADMIYLDYTKRDALARLVLAETPEWRTRVIEPFAAEWEKAAKESGLLEGRRTMGRRLDDGTTKGFPGLTGNKEALDILNALTRIKEPGVVNDLAGFMRGYTGFFRSYATLSPGFHVRNSISNVFSLFAAGSDIANMREGFRLWRMMDAEISRGGTIQSFVNSLPADKQEFARVAAETVYGLGHTRIDDALAGFSKKGNRITDNALLSFSRSKGNKVESSARYMLAYDSLVRGFTPDQSFNRTRRFLVDYQERTLLDEIMRDIVPFWTWMSRNLPLQVVNRWANPKPYLFYQKIQKNLQYGQEEDTLLPKYMGPDSGAINLGGGNVLMPDLPFSRVNQQIEDLANPRKLMSYVNPGIRTPLELMFNTNTYTGAQFKDEFVPVAGVFAPLLPLLQAAGQVEYNSQGQPVVRKKAMYALTNMIPPLSRAENLFPSTAAGQEKAGNALNSFLGIPVKSVTPSMRNSEAYRRMMQLQALQQRSQNIEGAK